MSFQPGQSGNPAGRPKGSVGGRTLALRALDEVLAEEANLATLKAAFEKQLNKDPLRFFKDVVMPLLPKQAILELAGEGAVRWNSLLDTFPKQDSTAAETVE